MAYYLAGPMRGYPNSNFHTFAEARDHLRSRGHDIICPVEQAFSQFGDDIQATDENFKEAMRFCYESVLKSEGVVVLPGWNRSEGAKAEVLVALNVGLPVYAYYRHRPKYLEELNINIITRAEILF